MIALSNRVDDIVESQTLAMTKRSRELKATGVVRMMADGNADFSKAIGLSADFSGYGMGTRSQRYSMLVKDGVVSQLHVEAPGKFEVSNAETMLAHL